MFRGILSLAKVKKVPVPSFASFWPYDCVLNSCLGIPQSVGRQDDLAPHDREGDEGAEEGRRSASDEPQRGAGGRRRAASEGVVVD